MPGKERTCVTTFIHSRVKCYPAPTTKVLQWVKYKFVKSDVSMKKSPSAIHSISLLILNNNNKKTVHYRVKFGGDNGESWFLFWVFLFGWFVFFKSTVQ